MRCPAAPLGPGQARALDLHTLAGVGPLARAGCSTCCAARLRRDPHRPRAISRCRRVQGVPLVVRERRPGPALGRSTGARSGASPSAGRALARAARAVPAELAHIGWLAGQVRRYTRRRYRPSAACRRPTPRAVPAGGPEHALAGRPGRRRRHSHQRRHQRPGRERPRGRGAGGRAAGWDRARGLRAGHGAAAFRTLCAGSLTPTVGRALLKARAGASGADFVYQRYQLGSLRGARARPPLGRPARPRVQRLRDLGRAPLGLRGTALLALAGGARAAQPARRLAYRRRLVAACAISWWNRASRAERVVVAPNGVDADGSPPTGRDTRGVASAPRPARGSRPWASSARSDSGTAPPAAGARRGRSPTHGSCWWATAAYLPGCATRSGPAASADRVKLTGLLERDQALRMLAACDVCVSPHVPNPDGTPFFGSPTKLFEYMGLGKPIVASDLDQIGEVIDHERNGLLVPPGDVARGRRGGAAPARRRRAARAVGGGSSRGRSQHLQLERARPPHPRGPGRQRPRRRPGPRVSAVSDS